MNLQRFGFAGRSALPPKQMIGLIFIATAGLMLKMTFCWWLMIFLGVTDLEGRSRGARIEPFGERRDITTAIGEFDDKLRLLVDKLQRVKQMALALGEADRLAALCGDASRRLTTSSSHQESMNDRGE